MRKKLLFAGGAFLFVLLILDIVSRVLLWTVARETAEEARQRDHAPRVLADFDFSNPYLPFIRPATVRGFLGKWEDGVSPPVVPHKEPNEIRILCWGASTTVDQPIYAKSWPGLLEKKLAAAYPDKRIVVIVQAHATYFTSDNLVLYALRSQDYNPDVIIVYDGWNDLIPSQTPGFQSDYSHCRGKPASVPPGILVSATRTLKQRMPWIDYSGFYQLTARLLERRHIRRSNISLYKDTGHPTQGYKGTDAFRRNAETIARLGVANGSQVVFASQITQFIPPFLEDRDSWLDTTVLQEHNHVLKTVGSTFPGCRFFDVAMKFPQESKLFSDRIHFSPEGSEILASLFFDFLTKDNNLIQHWNENNFRRTTVFPFGDLDRATPIGNWGGMWPTSMVGIREGHVANPAIIAPLAAAAAPTNGLTIPLGYMPKGSYHLTFGVAYDAGNYNKSLSRGDGVKFSARLIQGDAKAVITEKTLNPREIENPALFTAAQGDFNTEDGPADLELTWSAIGDETNSRIAVRYPIIRLNEPTAAAGNGQ